MSRHRRTTVTNERESSQARLLTALATAGEVRTASIEVAISTPGPNRLVDVTGHVRAAVEEAAIDTGIALVSTPHTTCAMIVNEAEEGFARDLTRTLESLAPEGAHYDHNDAPHSEENEFPNGYAHVRAALLSSPSVLLPVRDGRLALGRWQRVFLAELDRARPRTVQVTILGRAT